MKIGLYKLVCGAIAALMAASVAVGGEPPDLQATVNTLESALAEARQSEATAHARMASWTGAILARELKKVSASARLIEITEKTGRTEEVTRYRERHLRLLKTIADTTTHYESIVRHLGGLDPALVAVGFEQYQQYLVGKELASQIGIHRVVRKQVEAFVQSGEVDLKAWQKELQEH